MPLFGKDFGFTKIMFIGYMRTQTNWVSHFYSVFLINMTEMTFSALHHLLMLLQCPLLPLLHTAAVATENGEHRSRREGLRRGKKGKRQ